MLLPFALLGCLLALGAMFDMSFNAWIDFATDPKGALLLTAIMALLMVAPSQRRPCIDSCIRRTASLSMLIGAASALSAFLTKIIAVEQIFSAQNNLG